MEPRKKLIRKIDEVVLTGLWVLFSLLLALCASCLLCSLLYFVLLLWSLRRSAPLVLSLFVSLIKYIVLLGISAL